MFSTESAHFRFWCYVFSYRSCLRLHAQTTTNAPHHLRHNDKRGGNEDRKKKEEAAHVRGTASNRCQKLSA